jgi:hypothetical protein
VNLALADFRHNGFLDLLSMKLKRCHWVITPGCLSQFAGWADEAPHNRLQQPKSVSFFSNSGLPNAYFNLAYSR